MLVKNDKFSDLQKYLVTDKREILAISIFDGWYFSDNTDDENIWKFSGNVDLEEFIQTILLKTFDFESLIKSKLTVEYIIE